MMDSTSVITLATKGIVERMARENEITETAQYARLSADNCVYPKSKKLIRQIARLNPSGGELIRIDMLSMFNEVLDLGPCSPTSPSDFHRELSEAVQAKLTNLPRADRLRELRRAAAILDQEIRATEWEA